MENRIKVSDEITTAGQPSEEEIKNYRKKDLNLLSISVLPGKRTNLSLQKRRETWFEN